MTHPAPEHSEVEAAVLVVRDRKELGWDRGTLFAEGGWLGFKGEESSFHLPPNTWRRQRTPSGQEIVEVRDGSVLGIVAPWVAVRNLLTFAGAGSAPGGETEWPTTALLHGRDPGDGMRRFFRAVAVAAVVGATFLLVRPAADGLRFDLSDLFLCVLMWPILWVAWFMPHPANPRLQSPLLLLPLLPLMFAPAVIADAPKSWRVPAEPFFGSPWRHALLLATCLLLAFLPILIREFRARRK